MNIEYLVSKAPLLCNIDAVALTDFIESNAVFVKNYSKGTTVHHQYDVCKTLDIVLSGTLVAYSLTENGSAISMFEFQQHSMIGSNLLYGENHAYPLNIYSTSDCELLHITQPAVSDFLHEYLFVMQFIKSLSLNSQGLNRRITMIMQKTLRENILDYLKQQSVLQKSSTIMLPMSKKELADYLGVQRPSLFRELKRLEAENILSVENRMIRLIRA